MTPHSDIDLGQQSWLTNAELQSYVSFNRTQFHNERTIEFKTLVSVFKECHDKATNYSWEIITPSKGTLKANFNVTSDDQGSHPDNLSVFVILSASVHGRAGTSQSKKDVTNERYTLHMERIIHVTMRW